MDLPQVRSLRDELTKVAFDRKKFREGLIDEGIPLGGAVIGAGLGTRLGGGQGGLRGAALGYAAGGGASLLRSKMRGEKPSMGRKLLAAGALGYGTGGLAHWGAEKATAGMAARNPSGMAARFFHPAKPGFLSGAMEEAMPAAGATLATGVAYGMHRHHRPADKLQPTLDGKQVRPKVAAAR